MQDNVEEATEEMIIDLLPKADRLLEGLREFCLCMIISFGKSDASRAHSENVFVTGDNGGFAVPVDGIAGL